MFSWKPSNEATSLKGAGPADAQAYNPSAGALSGAGPDLRLPLAPPPANAHPTAPAPATSGVDVAPFSVLTFISFKKPLVTFTLAGLPIELRGNLPLFALISYVFYGYNVSLVTENPAAAWILALLIVIVLYTSIVLHELGHAGAMYLCGVKCTRAAVHGMGGFAEVEDGAVMLFGSPIRIAAIAFAGPLINLILGLLAILLSIASLRQQVWYINEPASWGVCTSIAGVIIGISELIGCVVNLLPILPADGSHVLFAVVAFFSKSTALAAIVSVYATIVMLLCAAVVLFVLLGTGYINYSTIIVMGFVLVLRTFPQASLYYNGYKAGAFESKDAYNAWILQRAASQAAAPQQHNQAIPAV